MYMYKYMYNMYECSVCVSGIAFIGGGRLPHLRPFRRDESCFIECERTRRRVLETLQSRPPNVEPGESVECFLDGAHFSRQTVLAKDRSRHQ